MAKEHISDAIRSFKSSLERFSKSQSQIKDNHKNSGYTLKDRISDNEKSFVSSVINSYKMYKAPFEVLGKDSIRAKKISDDEESLYKAFTLYKSIQDINSGYIQSGTFISDFEIHTPLTSDRTYTEGSQFIYLQAFLMFEKKCSDYIPFFRTNDKGISSLCFTETENHKFSANEKEIISCIKNQFYS